MGVTEGRLRGAMTGTGYSAPNRHGLAFGSLRP